MKFTTRDLSSRFIVQRDSGLSKNEADLKKTLEMLAKVSFSFAGYKNKTKKDLPSICAACSVSFGWWLYVKEERIICQLCEGSFCNKCASKTLSLNNLHSTKQDEKRVRVCNECNELVVWYRRRLDFQEKKRQAEISPITNFYRDTKNFHSQLLDLLTKFAETVSMISVADYMLPDTSQLSLSSYTEWNPLNSLSGWFSSTPAPRKSKNSQPRITESIWKSPSKNAEEPLTPDTDSLRLYQKASQLEQELTSTMQTLSRFLKESAESLTPDSERDKDLIIRIKNNSANSLSDINTSLFNLRRKITQMEMQIIEHAFIVTKRLLEELKNVSFAGCILPAIQECHKTIKSELEVKANTLEDGFVWASYEDELQSRIKEDKKRIPFLLNLPNNAQLYKVVVPRVIVILSSLEDYVRQSIAGDYFPNTIESLSNLTSNLKELCKK